MTHLLVACNLWWSCSAQLCPLRPVRWQKQRSASSAALPLEDGTHSLHRCLGRVLTPFQTRRRLPVMTSDVQEALRSSHQGATALLLSPAINHLATKPLTEPPAGAIQRTSSLRSSSRTAVTSAGGNSTEVTRGKKGGKDDEVSCVKHQQQQPSRYRGVEERSN